MDLVTQSKVKNGLIAVLLIVNLLTVSVIWMQTADAKKPQRKPADDRPPDALQLMQKALDLNEEQTERFRELQKIQLTPAREFNDRLDVLKLELAEELLKSCPDTVLAEKKAREIGEMQTRVEIFRFEHFRNLLALCSPEQREKMAPVIRQLYARKGAQKEAAKDRSQESKREKVRLQKSGHPDTKQVTAGNSNQPALKRSEASENERVGPPSLDEKLSRLNQRLDLSEAQNDRIKKVLEEAKRRGELVGKEIPRNSPEFEAKREEIRREEDEGIMRILTAEQQQEYQKMIAKRKK
jgi:Spy/CpxP family protein refolding chaperone